MQPFCVFASAMRPTREQHCGSARTSIRMQYRRCREWLLIVCTDESWCLHACSCSAGRNAAQITAGAADLGEKQTSRRSRAAQQAFIRQAAFHLARDGCTTQACAPLHVVAAHLNGDRRVALLLRLWSRRSAWRERISRRRTLAGDRLVAAPWPGSPSRPRPPRQRLLGDARLIRSRAMGVNAVADTRQEIRDRVAGVGATEARQDASWIAFAKQEAMVETAVRAMQAHRLRPALGQGLEIPRDATIELLRGSRTDEPQGHGAGRHDRKTFRRRARS
jgi:hypothetical protein